MTAINCRLQDAAGRVEACAGARCPFWEEEGGRPGCLLEPLDGLLEHRPDLAHYLLDLRAELDAVRRSDAPAVGRRLFYRLPQD